MTANEPAVVSAEALLKAEQYVEEEEGAANKLKGWLGGFVRYDELHGASFAPSPLVRKQTGVTAGFGISWIFATSSQRVRTGD